VSLLTNVVLDNAELMFRGQEQPEFPLVYDKTYGPYKPILSKFDSYHRNFVNLLLTNPGEWPMEPNLGIGIRRNLFLERNETGFADLSSRIRGQLERYLPEIKLLKIESYSTAQDIDNNKMKLIIVYQILNSVVFKSSFSLNSANKLFVKLLERFDVQNTDYITGLEKIENDERVIE